VIKDRLSKELETNVALRVSDTDSADTYEVAGRGQMHLTVLIENMRREGFELMIGPPQVIEKEIDGVKCEPFELLEITVPDEYMGAVVDLISKRKGEMLSMGTALEEGSGYVEYVVPTRGMIGLRNAMLTATRGMAIMESSFNSYRPLCGPINPRDKGSLLAHSNGEATTFGIMGAQDRGDLFISPKAKVYEDMIVGVHQRPGDLAVNVCREKALNNIRSGACVRACVRAGSLPRWLGFGAWSGWVLGCLGGCVVGEIGDEGVGECAAVQAFTARPSVLPFGCHPP
jgi:GTP-binding protein